MKAFDDKVIQWDEFEYNKNPKEYLEIYLQTTLDRIYEIIKEWTIRSNGISHIELTKQIKLDRKNLRKYTNRLIESGLIIREKGLHGKYLVKDIVDKYNNDFLIFQILSDKIKNILFQEKTKNKYFVMNENSISWIYSNDGTLIHHYDFTKCKRFFEPKFSQDDILEKKLFELSNLFGAYIVYLIIQGMNPDTIITKYNTNDRDKLIKKFIEKGVFSIINHFILNFNDITKKTILNSKSLNEYYTQTKKTNTNSTRLTNTKETIQKLLSAYNKIYPLLSYEFERGLPMKDQFAEILKDWPSALEPYRKYYEDTRKIQDEPTKFKKIQNKCKHDYHQFLEKENGSLIKLEKNDLSDYEPNLNPKNEKDFYVKICSKCDHKKRIRLKRESK